MPTVGIQLERNVDAETPTSGALPRTSNPVVLSLSCVFAPKLNNEGEPAAAPPLPQPQTSPAASPFLRFALILSLSLTYSL